MPQPTPDWCVPLRLHGRVKHPFRWCSLLLLVAAYPVISFATGEKYEKIPSDGFAMVTRGPLEHVVTTEGWLESSNNLTLNSQCEWTTRLVRILPEGTQVKPGEVVAELDSSELQERFDSRQVLLVNAEAAVADAQEDLRIQVLKNESALADAKLQVRLAELKLAGYEDAEYPQALHELQSELALAEETLTRSEKTFQFLERMARSGYRSQLDCEAERLKLLKAELDYSVKQGELKILTRYELPRTRTQLEAAYNKAVLELERVQSTGRSAVLAREIKLQSRQRSYEIYRAYQERLQRSIDACTIVATKTGEVIHATITPSSSRKLEEGYSVRFSQAVVKLPDRDQMRVGMRLHESLISFVEKSSRAVVQVSAAGGEYRGHVSHVSKVPMAGQYPHYDLREYRVTVDLEGDLEAIQRLAPGMTAVVNIIADERQSTIRVPLPSVVKVAGRHLVFVRSGDDVEARFVQVGIMSHENAEIISGLDEGEEVVLKPRVTCASRLLSIEGRELAHLAQANWPVN